MRIAVIGSSGAGKTTLARRIGAALSIPVIELDAINWQPGWRALFEDDPDEFVRRVEAATAGPDWVSDGNYRLAMPVLLRRVTDLIWLDYGRARTMTQVIWRSASRAFSQDELWPGTGNREDFRRWLDKEHPIRWAWDTLEGRRRRYAQLFADPRLAHIAKHRPRRPREADGLIAGWAARSAPASLGGGGSVNG
ncbi:MAG TPA: hypothetical protein VGS12_09230 [Caulobacteraceae bacterium]|nr:hypothetical protein [Caulobacteraceae bacterium]